jgi:hypothetical protein
LYQSPWAAAGSVNPKRAAPVRTAGSRTAHERANAPSPFKNLRIEILLADGTLDEGR